MSYSLIFRRWWLWWRWRWGFRLIYILFILINATFFIRLLNLLRILFDNILLFIAFFLVLLYFVFSWPASFSRLLVVIWDWLLFIDRWFLNDGFFCFLVLLFGTLLTFLRLLFLHFCNLLIFYLLVMFLINFFFGNMLCHYCLLVDIKSLLPLPFLID